MLELVDVRTGYGRTEIIHGATIVVPPSDGVVAVMGHNGAGKTTLLRAAVGLLPVASGKILLDGEDITALRPAAGWRAVSPTCRKVSSPSGSSPAPRTCRWSRTDARTAKH